MSHRSRTSTRRGTVIAAAAVWVLLFPTSMSAAEPAAAAVDAGAVPRTLWGAPDLAGIWDFRTMTPLQRPTDLGDKAVFNDDEAAEWEQRNVALRNKDRRTEDGLSAQADVASAYNEFWWDYGKTLTDDKRTSLIVDPPNGRIPALTEGALARRNARSEARRRPAHGPEDRGIAERCILGFNAGPPMNPSAYNNNLHLLQTQDTVVLLNEMVHDSRIVPLDGRSRLAPNVRQWRGDSRGRWEGDTLVVETTNFTDKTSFRGSGPGMRLTERFTRIDAERLIYEYTIVDPESFEGPWTAAIPMTKTDAPMFEYACHEGNYGMYNLLAGARAQEKEGETRTTASE